MIDTSLNICAGYSEAAGNAWDRRFEEGNVNLEDANSVLKGSLSISRLPSAKSYSEHSDH